MQKSLFDFGSYSLVLGSTSPRRRSLLSEMGFSFQIRTSSIDEIPNKDLLPPAIAEDLALQKANDIDSKEDEILLCADTIVVLDGKVLGKPKGKEEAIEMLTALSNRNHEVITGIALKSRVGIMTDHSRTVVKFKELTNTEIQFYVDNYSPMDKAGAYGIQEWIGQIGVSVIEGDYYNVVGLPCGLVYQKLKSCLNQLSEFQSS